MAKQGWQTLAVLFYRFYKYRTSTAMDGGNAERLSGTIAAM
jgi:hypothetical protein